MDDLTPIMGPPDLQYAETLSLERARPPLMLAGFEQTEFLGRGSFGEVWKAVDKNNGRQVAIKYYTRGGDVDWSHMAREVEKLRYLFSDRYVVQLFEVGWDSDPPYYVMEYMERGSLEDLLRTSPMSLPEALQMIRGVAQGLVHAHDKGILHCDLKPSNVMLDQDGNPRLADFGQARLSRDQSPSLGTLFYMAPEQADLNASPDARWDVYALGVILYRMIVGQLPYTPRNDMPLPPSTTTIDNRLAAYRQLIHSSPLPIAHRSVPGVDRALAEIIDRCLSKNPKRRFPNIQSVLQALDQRKAALARRPLLLLGGVGPLAVALILAVFAYQLFKGSVTTAENELFNRTAESNAFAAESVASRFALEIDKRWRILEREATHPELRRWLQQRNAGQNDAASAEAFHRWLAERHDEWNKQSAGSSTGSYWFVIDRHGMISSISPLESGLINAYFGYRDYFHGQGHEIPADAPVPLPIRVPHRSTVFRSKPNNLPAVAFSVPVWSDNKSTREVIGVLAMESSLTRISEFHGTRNQASVLIDLRPDYSNRRGLVVHHPLFEKQLQEEGTIQEYYLNDEMLARCDTIDAEHRTKTDRTRSSANISWSDKPADDPAKSVISPYRDPAAENKPDVYFAAMEPVFVARGGEAPVDTGWAILIQERKADTLRPLARLWGTFERWGLLAAVLIVLVLATLWGLVYLALQKPGVLKRRGWYKLGAGNVTSREDSASSSIGSASVSADVLATPSKGGEA